MTSLSLHGKTLALSLLLLFAIAMTVRWATFSRENATMPPLIVVEHEVPLTVTLRLSMRDASRVVDVAHDGAQTIFLSVPEDWKRTEVRGVPLTAVTASETAMGFTRWALPAKAQISLRTTGYWRQVTMRNPSRIPLQLSLTTVDLDTNRAIHDVFLIASASSSTLPPRPLPPP